MGLNRKYLDFIEALCGAGVESAAKYGKFVKYG
jgi:hypothetical protein